MIGTTIGNSLIWDNGTNVGIGNTNTSYTLDVSGTGRFTDTLIASAAIIPLRLKNTTGSTNNIQVKYFGALANADIWTVGTDVSTNNGAKDFEFYSNTLGATTLKLSQTTGAATLNGTLQVTTTSNNGITITTNDIATLKMSNSGGSTKNWGFATTNLAASDFGIYQSTSNGGDPITAGAAKLYFNGTGAATFASSVTAAGNIAVSGTTTGYYVNSTTAVARWSYFGYSNGYSGVLVGTTTGQSLFFNVDVTGNPSGSFAGNGSEYVWRNTGSFITPNSANNSYNTLLSWNSSGVVVVTTSDYRMKDDLKSFNALPMVEAIKLYDFKWIESQERMHGVIAHELQEIVPYAVIGEKDNERMQGVDYSKLVPIMLKAIQELSKQNEELSNRLIKLESK
jgi:hypothetical protein